MLPYWFPMVLSSLFSHFLSTKVHIFGSLCAASPSGSLSYKFFTSPNFKLSLIQPQEWAVVCFPTTASWKIPHLICFPFLRGYSLVLLTLQHLKPFFHLFCLVMYSYIYYHVRAILVAVNLYKQKQKSFNICWLKNCFPRAIFILYFL